MVRELCHFKVLKMGQNLYVNMEGFCRPSHKYNILCTLDSMNLKVLGIIYTYDL